MGSSSESSRTSSEALSGDTSVLGISVAEEGMEDKVTTREGPPPTA